MSNLRIISVGKESPSGIDNLFEEYRKRLPPLWQPTLQLVGPASGKMSITEQKERESQVILEGLSKDDFVILLDETGQLLNNHDLAKYIQDLQTKHSSIVFIIGGAYGVSDVLKQRVDYTWSLSPLVFPHMITRILLVEQLYRSYSITISSPYHHN